ncbi:hypothetical protein HG536_0B01950 [Torulaspora globosa]|uniref:Autophagy-related protein 14 n=1 Tax=Torulaspora globosa TaxID=48254 RepID=A0A7G3ZCU6_9SACH|nr:uncharacterized protein HG536_0B01950 [Torulaspora globosa]QLL31332.1 hypothetical protein HG536_0B01950 [Torulaspora globosa]
MRCPLCLNSSRPMYCSHCVNTSPNILARLKIDLLMLREENRRLKDRVESILAYGLGVMEGSEAAAVVERTLEEGHEDVEGEILGQRLLKLNQLRAKRKHNRIRYRTAQLLSSLEAKKRTIDRLTQEREKVPVLDVNAEEKLSRVRTAVLVEKTSQIAQIQRVLLNSQEAKLNSLRRWFIIRKRDSYEFPYSIAFQPVVSLKNFYKLPPMVAWGSISKMSEFVVLLSEVLQYKLPCELPDASFKALRAADNTVEDAYDDDTNVAEHLTKLLVNIIQLARRAGLMSKNPVDLAWMLDQLDIDTLFYNMATSTEIPTKSVAQHWTYNKLLSVVSEALQLSIYAASPASRQTLTGTLANNNDHWFLVG